MDTKSCRCGQPRQMSPGTINYGSRWTWWICLATTATVMTMSACVDGLHVSVDALGAKRSLAHFWSSTGFSPPASGEVAQHFLSSNSVTRNLDIIGALPNNAIRQIRVHWLLELIKPIRSEGSLTWNYELLDSFLDRVTRSGLRPRFELMGNPGGMFTDFSDEGHQAEIWTAFIRSMTMRFAQRYGLSEVSRWSFETWNEPDLRQYNIINMTFPAYISYFRETVNGLQGAENLVPGLKISLSGPAGLFKQKDRHPLCWGILEYCNRMAKENESCGLSEITYHHKGKSSVQEILTGGLSLAKRLNKEMPYLKHIPVSNDEADPISGWWRPLSWREDVRMAAMIAQSVAIHMDWVLRGKPRVFNLLGGDHGFLAQPPNFFNQRTLLARFPISETNEQVFRKPSLGAMFLLGMLGNKVVTAEVTGTDKRLSVIATSSMGMERQDWTVEVLLVLSEGTKQNSSEKISVDVTIRGLQNRCRCYGAIYRVLQLSSALPHPASIWDLAGRPEKPNATLRAHMRAVEGPHVLQQLPLGMDTLSVNITLPSVTLVQVCGPSKTLPGRVTGLRAVNVTFNEVLILFRDKLVTSKCITTFQVEFCKGDVKSKQCTVLKGRNMYLAYHYAPQGSQLDVESVRGRYRVRAVDVWGRPGPYSKPITYG